MKQLFINDQPQQIFTNELSNEKLQKFIETNIQTFDLNDAYSCNVTLIKWWSESVKFSVVGDEDAKEFDFRLIIETF